LPRRTVGARLLPTSGEADGFTRWSAPSNRNSCTGGDISPTRTRPSHQRALPMRPQRLKLSLWVTSPDNALTAVTVVLAVRLCCGVSERGWRDGWPITRWHLHRAVVGLQALGDRRNFKV